MLVLYSDAQHASILIRPYQSKDVSVDLSVSRHGSHDNGGDEAFGGW
jgi:hypothetical protein